jgi:regulator of ribonuclease activity A
MTPSTCDLLDERPELGCCVLPLRSLGARRAFSGTIQTVSCLEDNVVMRAALDEPGEGRVLVVDGHGSLAIALLGDAMARRAAEAGWAGLIVNGAVRDHDALAAVELGILALGVVPRRARKDGVGATGVPISFGGATFVPGGTVWCDADGVVVAAPAA